MPFDMPVDPVDAGFALGYLVSAAVGLVVGLRLIRTHRTTTARGFGAALLAGAAWSIGGLVVLLSGPEVHAPVYAVVVLPSVAVLTAAFTCGILALARSDWRPGGRLLVLLAIHPVVMLVLGATNGAHHLVVRPPVPDTAPATEMFGPLFWVHSAYAYGLLIAAAVLATRLRRRVPALRRRQLTVVLRVGLLPGIGVAAQLMFLPAGVPDVTPVLFVVIGLVDAHMIFRGKALSLPVARGTVVETIRDGIVVLDAAGVVVDANPAALRLLTGMPLAADVVGRPAEVALTNLGAVSGDAGPVVPEGRQALAGPTGPVDVDVTCEPIRDQRGRALGTVVLVRDVTADVHREDALRQANDELRAHLVTIERLREEVAEQAVRDAVTGLHNRRHLDAVLAERLLPADGEPVALAIIDADHFKDVNDRHGHAAGDRVLEALARALEVGTMPGDTLVRYGGEEFVVVLTGLDESTAVARVERLRALCAQARAATRDGDVGVTVSAGLALSGPGRTTPGALLDAADRALYEAKRAGRDRLAVAPCDHPAPVAG